jgi:uncharacterized protein (TIGR02300 family)
LVLTETREHGNWLSGKSPSKTKELQRVTKADLGSKRTCPECGARFFDLKKKNPECIKCGTVCEDPKPAKPRRGARPAATPIPVPIPLPAAEATAAEAQDPVLAVTAKDRKEEAEANVIDDLVLGEGGKDLKDVAGNDEDEDKLIEDTSDLGKDTDDVSEVMEHVDDGIIDKV